MHIDRGDLSNLTEAQKEYIWKLDEANHFIHEISMLYLRESINEHDFGTRGCELLDWAKVAISDVAEEMFPDFDIDMIYQH